MDSPTVGEPTAPLLSIEGFTRRFGAVTAVDGLSLRVMSGEIFGLIGPDGAGKTTAMRLMLGILRPDSGSGHVGGYDLVRDSESVTRLTGYVSQRFSLYGELSVEENLKLFADLYGVPESERQPRLDRLMQFSRLGPFRDRLAQNLSGGMKQKLALSCALIHTPKLLLLDEPTTGVDPLSRRDLWRLLFDLWQEGVTIIVSTPYMDEAERCSRVGFINAGRHIRTGTPEELRRQFDGTILEVLAGNRFAARSILAALPDVADINPLGDGLRITMRDRLSGLAESRARHALETNGIQIHSITAVEPTIEDVYFQLTRAR